MRSSQVRWRRRQSCSSRQASLRAACSRSRSADVGFRADGLAVVSADLDLARYDAPRAEQFWRTGPRARFGAAGRRVGGVGSPAALLHQLQRRAVPCPGSGVSECTSAFRSRTRASRQTTSARSVSRSSKDEASTSADTPESPNVVVINETMARRFWKDRSALGQRIHLRTADGPAFEIVGVAADHHVRTVGESPQPYVHFAASQRMTTYQVLVARTRGDARPPRRGDPTGADEPRAERAHARQPDDGSADCDYPAAGACRDVGRVGGRSRSRCCLPRSDCTASSPTPCPAERARSASASRSARGRARSLSLVMRQGLTSQRSGWCSASCSPSSRPERSRACCMA